MIEELLPKDDDDAGVIGVIMASGYSSPGVHSAAVSTGLQQEVIAEEEVASNISSNLSSGSGNSAAIPTRRSSLARYRKKSRRLTLTQVCSEEATSLASALHQSLSSPNLRDQPAHIVPEPVVNQATDEDRVSNSSNSLSFDSIHSSVSSSSSGAMSSSSSIPPPERKISRIFSMLQSMQNTFFSQQQQQIHQPPTPLNTPQHYGLIQDQLIHQHQLASQPGLTMYPRSNSITSTAHSDTSKFNSLRRQPVTTPAHQLFYGIGRSQESFVLTAGGGVSPMTTLSRPIKRPMMMERNMRLGSVNSWTGSQCSGYTCSTVSSEGPPPPLVHAMPYHKDGWTSCFIVGSSTYAQLLIVICVVAALSEVVTHNVPFLYFEGLFAYLYTVSILFFLYVFGYLLRSKRRREEKRRLRKLNKWRAANMAANSNRPSPSSEQENGSVVNDGNSSCRSRSASVVCLENETVGSAPSPLNRFVNSIKSQRRRFSRTDLSLSSGSSVGDLNSDSKSVVSQNPSHHSQLQQHRSLQWTPSSVGFSLGDDSLPSEAVSYAMNSDNVIGSNARAIPSPRIKTKKMKVSDNEHSHGSFFLRAGAVAFGLGTMIYDGLEFGAFLEVPPDSPCFAMLRGLNPVLHATFVFLQMYFIFISARLNIHKFKAIARFGLMHCLATNVAVWVRTLVRESLKEINGHYHHYEKNHQHGHHAKEHNAVNVAAAKNDAFLHHMAEAVAAVAGNEDGGASSSVFDFVNDTVADAVSNVVVEAAKEGTSLWELTGNVSCGRRIFLGDLIMDAAPFLYPFLIEYSLIGAAVLYVIWAHIGLNPKYKTENIDEDSTWNSKSRQLRVDCVGASKGLFIGLFFLTASLLCLVLFFIFAPQPQFHRLGLFLADAAHCTLLLVSLCAMAIGAYRTRHLHFHSEHMEELGNILLRVSALGIFAYSVFSMIAGALANPSSDEPPLLVLITGLLSVIEVTVQMLFISDMSRRRVSTVEQDREKPGRQAVTFLLITNLTLWLVYTFEMQKVEANPVQLNFYGFLPWAIVQRITLPLCIFYRFHSAIVYAEIWKNSYRFQSGSSSADETLSQHYVIA